MTAPSPSFFPRLKEYFSLEERQREAARETLAQREQAYVLAKLASEHAEAARVLRNAGMYAQANELFWKAIHELSAAYLTRTDSTFALDATPRAQVFERTLASLKAAGQLPPPELERYLSYLSHPSPEAHAWLETAEAKTRAVELDALARALGSTAQPMPLHTVPRERALRAVSAASIFFMCLLGYVAWKGWPVNVALNKPAHASSLAFGTTADRAVNGQIWPDADFHTDLQEHPYLVIDLGTLHHLSSAEIWTRRDCCPDQSVPMELQLSTDGKQFKTVARRDEPVDLKHPWVIESLSDDARFVRVQSMRETYLALNEVMVFGRRAE